MGAWKDAVHTDIQDLLREPRELALLTWMTPSPHLSTPTWRRVQRKSEQQHQARPAHKSSQCRAREAPRWHFKCNSPREAAPPGVSLGSETKGRNPVPARGAEALKLAPGPLSLKSDPTGHVCHHPCSILCYDSSHLLSHQFP